ncbi:MAG: hypothetical protein P4L50_02795 [Anaerolineaceae bacterium]|nr:hypothetical protein [Anaerolineaceae bacterium]
MSEDPEIMKNQEDSPPAVSESTPLSPVDPAQEASLPETQIPEGSAPVLSKLEASDTGEGLISDFRQSLVKQEESETAGNAQKVIRPGIIQRITGILNRKTGKIDEDRLPLPTEAIDQARLSDVGKTAVLNGSDLDIPEWASPEAQSLVEDGTAPVANSLTPGKVAPLADGDFSIPQWASAEEQGDSQGESLPKASLFDPGQTVTLSSSDLDMLRGTNDEQNTEATGEINGWESATNPPEPLEPAQNPSRELEIETSAALDTYQPQAVVTDSDKVGSVENSHEPGIQNPTTEESLLGGLETSTTPLIQSAEPSAPVLLIDQLEPQNTQPKQGQSFWRRVTDILKSPVKPKVEPEAEVLPDTQILDRLNKGPDEALQDGLLIPVNAPSAPEIENQEQSTTPEVPPQIQPVEASPEIVPSEVIPDQPIEQQPVVDEDRAIWSAYVDVPTADQGHSTEPSPFVDDSISQLSLGDEEPVQSRAFETDQPETGKTDEAAPNLQSPEGMSPFLMEDSPWLGELRGAIDAEDDLSIPFPEPETETPPEKSDIWDRLFAEEKRGDQATQTTQTPDSALPGATDAFWETSALRAASAGSDTAQEPESHLEFENQTVQDGSGEESSFDSADQGTPVSHEPFWSETDKDESTDGFGSWFERASQEQSEMLELPEPSEEASQELKESTRLYDSIFEDQKQQEMRSMLLGEESSRGGAAALGTMPDFTKEAREQARPWWARLTKVQIGLMVVTVIVLIGLAAAAVIYLNRSPAVIATTQPSAAVQSSKPNMPYPIGIQLTGGWIFALNRSSLVQGVWNPKSAEWLEGTQVRRVIALPWSRQTEAVVRSFQPGDQISLLFNNKQTIQYKVSEVRQVLESDVSVLSDTHPSLAVILYQSGSQQRWVVIAAQKP